MQPMQKEAYHIAPAAMQPMHLVLTSFFGTLMLTQVILACSKL